MGFLPFVIIGFIILAGAPLVFFLLSVKARKSGAPAPRDARLEAPVRDAMRRLGLNPRDAKALLTAAEAAFRSEDFLAAQKYYKRLMELSGPGSGVDEFEAALKHGIAAYKSGAIEEAFGSLLVACRMNESSFEANYTLGCLEYGRDAYDKAAAFLLRAHTSNPDHALTVRLLGSSLFQLGRYRDASVFLRKAVEYLPDDKDALFELGQACDESDQKDAAAKIFSHLRADPRLGPKAALRSATINLAMRQYDRAIEDLQIGLRHDGVSSDARLELEYLQGLAHLKKGDTSRALEIWRSIATSDPAYKDVAELIARYGEITSNARLQSYLLSPTPVFVTLCRTLASAIFPRARVKILTVSIRRSEYIDIAADVDAGSWHDVVLYRFVRGSALVGELVLRDLYAKLKELKGARGVCVAPASFSESAKSFVQNRVLDLVDKPVLIKLLQKVPAA